MRFSVVFGALSALAAARPVKKDGCAALPPYFILSGDSTTASGGGWGTGLLPLTQDGAGGVNHARNGATTVSFRADGRWAAVLASIAEVKADHEPVVTIQFGHNDQKPDKGISLEQFQTNLETLANEVIAAGGTPIIATSLTRRTFSNGAVVENLVEHSAAAIAAADNVGIKHIELNRASTDYINAVGQANADTYNLVEGDRTHLNPSGQKVFGRLVADLLVEVREDLEPYLKQNQVLSDKIAAGEYVTGDEA